MTTETNNSPTDGGDEVEQLLEEMSITVEDGRPVIEIGDAQIHLRVHYVDGRDGFSTVDDGVTTEWDADGDNGVWWTVYADIDSREYVEIDPFVKEVSGQ